MDSCVNYVAGQATAQTERDGQKMTSRIVSAGPTLIGLTATGCGMAESAIAPLAPVAQGERSETGEPKW
jgi:hypothetical protein